MTNKEEQYMALYFPEAMIEDKQRAYDALLDIDANFSKLIQLLLPDIIAIGELMAKDEANYRDYVWELRATRKDANSGKKEKGKKEKDRKKGKG